MMAMDRLILKVDKQAWNQDWMVKEALEIFREDQKLCDNMAEQGARFVEDGDAILTHCNTGGLATVGVGTAFGVIRKAHEDGKKIHVYAICLKRRHFVALRIHVLPRLVWCLVFLLSMYFNFLYHFFSIFLSSYGLIIIYVEINIGVKHYP